MSTPLRSAPDEKGEPFSSACRTAKGRKEPGWRDPNHLQAPISAFLCVCEGAHMLPYRFQTFVAKHKKEGKKASVYSVTNFFIPTEKLPTKTKAQIFALYTNDYICTSFHSLFHATCILRKFACLQTI